MILSQGSSDLLNKHYILSKTTEELILAYYIGVVKIPCVINSPLRVDKKPSFGLYYSKSGISFVDFKTREAGSLFDLIGSILGLDYENTLIKIINDLPEIGYSKNINREINQSNRNVYKLKKNIELKVKIRPFKDFDLLFWSEQGIELKALKFGNVYAISKIFIYRDKKEISVPADKYAYCYVEFKDNKETIKIYQPFSENFKWLNSHDSSVWDLWGKLPSEGKELIIATSRKDALCLWSNLRIPSTSLQGEGYLPKKHVVQELCSRFNTIYYFADNDFNKEENYGIIYGKKLCDLFGFRLRFIPDEFESKDPSDLFKNINNKNNFISITKNLLYG